MEVELGDRGSQISRCSLVRGMTLPNQQHSFGVSDGPRENVQAFSQVCWAVIAADQQDGQFNAGVGLEPCSKIPQCDIIGDLAGGEAFQPWAEADDDADHSRLPGRHLNCPGFNGGS